MAAPSLEAGVTGQTDAGGAWSFVFNAGGDAGRVILVALLQDGTTAGAVAVTGSANINDLAGSAGWTSIGTFNVGDPTAALLHLFIGRSTSALNITISGTNSTSEDLYLRGGAYVNVSSGTTLATVIENGTAGSTSTVVGTSATVSDAAVTTLGPDRLAINIVGVNDDNPLGAYSGTSGGTWAIRLTYAESSGTDGALYFSDATLTSAGTIDGGTASITDSDAWVSVGFALIGTTPSTRQPRHGFVLFQDPGIM